MPNREQILLNPNACADRIRSRAAEYFPDLDPKRIKVTVLQSRGTRNSRLLEFEVTDGVFSHRVIAKAPFSLRRLRRAEGHESKRVGRLRLFQPADTKVKGLHEYEALSKIYDHFSSMKDPRFGAVRPLDIFGEPYCLIMEKTADQSLQIAWRGVNRFQSSVARAELSCAIRNAGAWLRRFHEMPFPSHTKECLTLRSDVVAAIELFCGYLKSTSGDSSTEAFCKRLTATASSLLLHSLPLGLTHRDFAPRNLLMNSAGKITVLDTQGSWLAAVYADLAYFLISLKVSRVQICSAGMYRDSSTVAAFEHAFLQGYFENRPVPAGAIRLFECLMLLEWWVQLVYAYRKATGVRRAVSGAQLLACRHYIKRYLHHLMNLMDKELASHTVDDERMSEVALAEAG